MNINYSDKDSISIIHISGRIDGNNSSEVEEELNSVLETGKKKILIDLSGVDYISSSGLRVFLSTRKRVKSFNARMILSGLKPFVMSVFTISGFTNLFEIYEDCDTAYQSFSE
ncbi:MAG: STAS domain-containing protein [Methanomicrobium sp.]|nr:STAS domain-containing protein [Methanomicrobium sp.]